MISPSSYQNFFAFLKQWMPYYVVVMISIEMAVHLIVFKRTYSKETWVNIATGVISIVIQAFLKTLFFAGLYPYIYEHRIWDLELNAYMVLLGFFMYTFIQFGTHFLYHKVRLLWCLHEVHHSATKMDATTGLRTSIFDIVSLDILYILIPLAGVHPIVYFILYSLNKIWGTFIHFSEKIISRIPFLEYILVTPGMHQIHHACNPCYLDKNYGEVIPWWDRIFSTYAQPMESPVYGTTLIKSEIGFWEAQVHEFRSLWKDVKNVNSLANKIKYFFMPPGWHPGNITETSRYIQKKYNEDLHLPDVLTNQLTE